MKKIAIIPARGGSKRIPRKNIKLFHGKPIIQYSIDAAIQAKIFDEVMVSTDDEEITDISRSLGAGVPFLRSKKTADDFSGLAEVLIEVLAEYTKMNFSFDYICCILPTAPFIKPERLIESFQLLTSGKYDSIIPVRQFSYPIQRAMSIENNRLKMIWPENYQQRSQDLSPSYHDSGQFYWIKTAVLHKEKRLYTSNTGGLIISDLEAQDIDIEEDWKLAEAKFELLIKKKP